jgi:hypothetical protein
MRSFEGRRWSRHREIELRMAFADRFEREGVAVLRGLLRDRFDAYRQLAESVLGTQEVLRIGRTPTDTDLRHIVAGTVLGLRQGTPDEGKAAFGLH